MALTLRLRSGDVDPEPELPFDAPRVVVGRAPGCDLQLPDPSVSPRHASLRQRGSDYVVVDEGSDNGTFVAGQRLTRHAAHTLRDGDLLRFGRVWVQVRLGPAEHAVEARASRELARRVVDAALAADGKLYGMRVRVDGAPVGAAAETSLVIAEPRHPYLIGGKKASDLRVTGLPSRCLEVRRQADQLWVTLQDGASGTLGDKELAEGERTAWSKGTVLTVGEVRLVLEDPTAQMLERLEKERTERLADDAIIDPPSGGEENPEEDDDEGGDEDDEAEAESDIDEVFADPDSALPAATALPRPAPSWSRADAIVFMLALSVLGLSLWAISWLAHLGSA